MKTKNLTKSLAATALIVFAINVFAKPANKAPCPQWQEVVMVRSAPGFQQLDNKQRAAAKKVMQKFRKQTSPLRQQLFAKRTLLKAELVQTSLDQKKIDALIDEISALRKQLFTARVQVVIELQKATGINIPLNR